MTNDNIERLAFRAKPRRLESTVEVTCNGEPISSLSPTERLAIAYDIAERSAAALAADKSMSLGHRNAMYAHTVLLMNRDGEQAVRTHLAVLCGMVGLQIVKDPTDPGMPMNDPTDWSNAALR